VRMKELGLPETFDPKSGRRLGMRLVTTFSQQLQADLRIIRHNPGTEFAITFPATESTTR
jgi:two-component sensor histidine kinase